jgi:EAL domain-containing protein (putative c-di-GMP-specific phosphodiesterase class I)
MNTTKKHILLVDDERDYVELLSLRIQSRDYKVSIAYSGEEALEKANDGPDLILLDINLPKMNGYEVCQRLRQNKGTSFIPIIMITGRDDASEKIEGLYTGADDYITKPFNAEELFARIDAVFRRAQKHEEFLEDKANAIHEINQIIKTKSMIPLFQPIFHLRSGKLLGIEVLSRPPVKNYFNNTEILFDTAFRLGMHFELEIACHKKALKALGGFPKKALISFNINPYLVEDYRFKDLISFHKPLLKTKMIGFELTERTSITNFSAFFKRLKIFKEEGFKILIDDIGSGYASLSSIVELQPDFIKTDLHLTRNIDSDPVRQNLFKAISMFCKQVGIILIAEGVESRNELDTLIKLGVDAGQGFYLGRPYPEIQTKWKIGRKDHPVK